MVTNRSARNSGTAVGAAVLAALVLAAAAMVEPAYAVGESPGEIEQEMIAVSCFKGNLDAGNFIGSLTVTTPQAAGRRCNSVYIDCDGECVGCFTNSNGVQVCYDNEGRKAQR